MRQDSKSSDSSESSRDPAPAMTGRPVGEEPRPTPRVAPGNSGHAFAVRMSEARRRAAAVRHRPKG